GSTSVFNSLWRKLIAKIRLRRLVGEFDQKCRTENPDPRKVLLLCYGNICRSAFAEAVWNSGRTNIASARSAGTHAGINRRTPARIRLLARRLGIELSHHTSKQIDGVAIEEATAIFVMDGQNIEDLLKMYPQARS